jgi:hypothetical protein
MKLTAAGADFTNVFALLGNEQAKAACKMLVKSTPELNFINVLCTAFMLADPKSIKRCL